MGQLLIGPLGPLRADSFCFFFLFSIHMFFFAMILLSFFFSDSMATRPLISLQLLSSSSSYLSSSSLNPTPQFLSFQKPELISHQRKWSRTSVHQSSANLIIHPSVLFLSSGFDGGGGFIDTQTFIVTISLVIAIGLSLFLGFKVVLKTLIMILSLLKSFIYLREIYGFWSLMSYCFVAGRSSAMWEVWWKWWISLFLHNILLCLFSCILIVLYSLWLVHTVVYFSCN